jgi:hypothetical protein
MKDPKDILTLREGATYIVPTYSVTDDGLESVGDGLITFVKGDKSNPNIHRQSGFMTETLLQVSKKYLEDVQQGNLVDEDTQDAIKYIELAIRSLEYRQEKRKAKGVNQTYKP